MSETSTTKKEKKSSGTLRERGYKQVSLPLELIEYIEKFIKNNKHLGYTSIPDFIRAAIREKLNL